MKNLIFSCCCVCLLVSARGQITGKVATTAGRPVASANVLLLNVRDSSLKKASLSGEDGSYRFESIGPGRYFVQVSSVGYQSLRAATFELMATPLDLGVLVLSADTVQLSAAVVRATKPLFQQQPSGTTINVENSILTKGSSALEVLERSPGILLDRRNNAISLNGKSGVLVLLNGRMLRMGMDQVVALLNSMPADNIEKIELLTSPPASYDADGNAGLINIVTKKNRASGTSGSLTAAGGFGYGEKGSLSVNLAHNSGPLDVYGSYAFSHDRSISDWHAYSTQDLPLIGGKDSADFASVMKPVSNSHTITAGLDWKMSPKTTIGAAVNYNISHVALRTRNIGAYFFPGDSVLTLDATIDGVNRWRNGMYSVYIDKKLRDGESISADVDLLDYHNEHPTTAVSSFVNAHGEQAGSNDTLSSPLQRGASSTGILVGVGKIDYRRRLSEHVRLETGIKGTYTRTTSESSISSLVDGRFVSREGTTSNLVMKEGIGAGYANVTADLASSLNLVAGLRYEYSDTRMTDPLKNVLVTERKLGKLFPAIFLSYKIGTSSELQLAYTMRISRPSYNDLASFVVYTGPTSIETGNPLLKPTITNSLKLGYNYKGYSFSATAGRDVNPIVRYQISYSSDSLLMAGTTENLEYNNSLLFRVNAPFRITDWWSMSYSLTFGWWKYKENFTVHPMENTWFQYSGNFSQSFRLPRSFALEVSGWYLGKSYDGTKRLDAFGALNAGLRKTLPGNRGSLQLFMTDILRTGVVTQYYGTLTKEAFDLRSRVPYRPESTKVPLIRLSYSRSFGGGSRDRRGGAASEERERVRQ